MHTSVGEPDLVRNIRQADISSNIRQASQFFFRRWSHNSAWNLILIYVGCPTLKNTTRTTLCGSINILYRSSCEKSPSIACARDRSPFNRQITNYYLDLKNPTYKKSVQKRTTKNEGISSWDKQISGSSWMMQSIVYYLNNIYMYIYQYT